MKGKGVPLLVLGVLLGVAALIMFQGKGGEKQASAPVKMPDLTQTAMAGRDLFRLNCAQCHNADASGTQLGPPLIHKYYEPSHHGDGAFYRAATNGVMSHHWQFGNMPPIRTVSRDDMTKVIAYVREVQRANGIF